MADSGRPSLVLIGEAGRMTSMTKHLCGACVALLSLASAGAALAAHGASDDPFPSTYHPAVSVPLAIVGATVLTGTGAEIADQQPLIADRNIPAVGTAAPVPAGSREAQTRRARWADTGG